MFAATVPNRPEQARVAYIRWAAPNVHRNGDITRINKRLSRRVFLTTTVSADAGGLFIGAARPQDVAKRLVAGVRTLEINGRPAKVFGLVGPDVRAGLILEPAASHH